LNEQRLQFRDAPSTTEVLGDVSVRYVVPRIFFLTSILIDSIHQTIATNIVANLNKGRIDPWQLKRVALRKRAQRRPAKSIKS
jgi:hypothetical protein